jgi:leucyl-tRNA synthetase
MSKSRGNVVNPDDYVTAMGADTVRTYLMFIGPWEGGGPWNSRGIDGAQRFLNRVWTIAQDSTGPRIGGTRPARNGSEARELRHWTHRTIKKVTDDMSGFHFNTAISALMEFVNYLHRAREAAAGTEAWDAAVRTLLLLLAPVAPHITEELWERRGGPYSVHEQPWPAHDEALARAEMITLVLQVDGKVRDRIQVSADLSETESRELALRNEKVRKFMNGRPAADVVVVPGRLVNIVTG